MLLVIHNFTFSHMYLTGKWDFGSQTVGRYGSRPEPYPGLGVGGQLLS